MKLSPRLAVYTFPDATYRTGDHPVTRILRGMGFPTEQFQDDEVDPSADMLWILGNPSWYPRLIRQLSRLPAPRKPFVMVWHYEPLPPPRSSGRPWPLLPVRELFRMALRRKRINNIYTNYFRLRSIHARGLIDRLVVSMEGRALMLQERGINAVHIPLGYASDFGRDLSLPRDLDVVYLGDLIPGLETRRRKIIHRLRHQGVKIDVVGSYNTAEYWGEKRTRFLNRTRILLNLHRFPGDLAALRMMLGMANKALIISEPADFPAPYLPNQHYVSVEIDQMPANITSYLADDESRQEIAMAGYQFVTEQLTMEKSVRRILEVCGPGSIGGLGPPEQRSGENDLH